MDFVGCFLFDVFRKTWELASMNQADVVRRYLQNPRDVDFHDTGFPFVTISRQAGTNAHALGRYIIMRLAEYEDPDLTTGWDLFDQKLCALIAQNKNLDADYDALVNEKYRAEGLHRMIYEMLIGSPQQYKIQKKIDEVIRLLARLGKVVIVGRAGFLITRDMPGGIHLRLIASEDYRVHYVMQQDHVSEDQAVKHVRTIDAERANFLKNFHNFNIRDNTQFDIVWNVERVRTSEIITAMAELVHIRLKHFREKGTLNAV